jgi:hypothetical protein
LVGPVGFRVVSALGAATTAVGALVGAVGRCAIETPTKPPTKRRPEKNRGVLMMVFYRCKETVRPFWERTA